VADLPARLLRAFTAFADTFADLLGNTETSLVNTCQFDQGFCGFCCCYCTSVELCEAGTGLPARVLRGSVAVAGAFNATSLEIAQICHKLCRASAAFAFAAASYAYTDCTDLPACGAR
jgi:hypothetical protein